MFLTCLHAANEPPMIDEVYSDYRPRFTDANPNALMKFSTQPTFYNKAYVVQDKRVYALLKAGIKCEQEKEYEKAIKHYRKLIDKFPESTLQVSTYGVFVSAVAYIQQRILRFPKRSLSHYRTLYEPPARDLYASARKRNSVEGLHDVINLYRATSFGAKALQDLGSHALDQGHYERAVHYFVSLKDWFPGSDYSSDEVNLRLALAYRYWGKESACRKVLAEIKNKTYIQQLKQVKPITSNASITHPLQTIKTKHKNFNSYQWHHPLTSRLAMDRPVWLEKLPSAPGPIADDKGSGGEYLPFHQPWIVGNSLYYKHYNRIYCQSPITGRLRWSFEIGASVRDISRIYLQWRRRPLETLFWAAQDIGVDDDRVYANVQTYGRREALVAIDRVTGDLQWTAGSIHPVRDRDTMTRYSTAPALGKRAVYAPWIYDEGEGDNHLYSVVGLTAFDKSTGQIIWEREICRLTPHRTTQESRDIRVFPSTPVLHEGILYYLTNAGTVAAIDAVSGKLQWLARYPHHWIVAGGLRRGTRMDAHNSVQFGAHYYKRSHVPQYTSYKPLLFKDRLYLSPVDSQNFLCLDRKTGKLLWDIIPGTTPNRSSPIRGYFAGIAPTNELVFAGNELNFHDADTGKWQWRYCPSYRATWVSEQKDGSDRAEQYRTMRIVNQPTITEDGKLYFCARVPKRLHYIVPYNHEHGNFISENCLSLTERRLLDYRIHYSPKYIQLAEGVLRGKIKNSKRFKEFLHLAPPKSFPTDQPVDLIRRLPFRLFDLPCELITNGNDLKAFFDETKLLQAVQACATSKQAFIKAELMVNEGKEKEAIQYFEKCKALIQPEQVKLIQEVDQELYRLYKKEAWRALLANDLTRFQQRTGQMAETASSVYQELEVLLVRAELFEKKNKIDRAVACLQNVIRHYPGIVYPISTFALQGIGQRQNELNTILEGLDLARPASFDKELGPLTSLAKSGLQRFDSIVSPAEKDLKLEADILAIQLLKNLLKRHPAFKGEFETRAEQMAASDKSLDTIKLFPKTNAAQQLLTRILQEEKQGPLLERRHHRWIAADMAGMLELAVPDKIKDTLPFAPPAHVRPAIPDRFMDWKHTYEDSGSTLRLFLTRHGDRSAQSGLIFVGGRTKKRLDNKFSLECWDIQKRSIRWEQKNIRLKGKGNELGFQEAYLRGDQVITHGKYDVLAFGVEKGELQWRERLPYDLNLQSLRIVQDLLLLFGASHTLALDARTGKHVWDAAEIGELYSPPYLRKDVLINVRREPFGVSFRALGSGRLIRHLNLPDLNTETSHPLLSEKSSQGMLKAGVSSAALPIACQGDLLILSDDLYYLAVDLKTMAMRWKRKIDNHVPGTSPAIRFFLHEPYLLVLKSDFGKPTLYLIDSRTGAVKWKKPEQSCVYSIVFNDNGRSFLGLGIPESGVETVKLHQFKTETGKEESRTEWKGYETIPDARIMQNSGKGRICLRTITTAEMQLTVRDTGSAEDRHRISLKAVGKFNVHGGLSVLLQDSCMGLMNAEGFQVMIPKR